MQETPMIYISDPTHGKTEFYPGLDAAKASTKYETELWLRIDHTVERVSIGAGGDWPAFAVELTDYDDEIFMLTLVLLFIGKEIDEKKNIYAWLLVAEDIMAIIKDTRPFFNRSSAFLCGLLKVTEQRTRNIGSIQLLEYRAYDNSSVTDEMNIDSERIVHIDDTPQVDSLSTTVHYFRLSIDGEDVSMSIHSDENAIRVSKKKSS